MQDSETPRRRANPSTEWVNATISTISSSNSSNEPEIELSDIERIRRDAFNRLRIRSSNSNGNTGQVLDTIGIELESIALTRDKVTSILSKVVSGLGNNFRVHRDGSSEINAFVVSLGGGRNTIMVNSHTPDAEKLFGSKNIKTVLGYELISNPLDIYTAEITLWTLLPMLEKNGDFVSERCATHIHVGAMKNLAFLKNCLRLGLWFDEVFYSLAHMDGERFRGYSNNAIYARPIQNGPYFRYDRTHYQILNWEKALHASDMYEFFACYGANVNSEMIKYHPGRYFSINLYSVPRIGTVEFRHFNQTFNPAMVSAVAKLCQIFVEVAMKARDKNLKHLDIGNVFAVNHPNYYIDKLYRFLDLANSLDCDYSLDKDDLRVLENIISSYKGIGIEDKEVLTHCREFEISSSIFQDASFKKAKNKPCVDGHIDIHNIKYQSIILK